MSCDVVLLLNVCVVSNELNTVGYKDFTSLRIISYLT